MKQPDQWSRYAHRILASGERLHFAPEPETLDVHAHELERTREAMGASIHVLVLGATPELADLALDQGCRVTRMDCNPAMFDAAARRQRRLDRRGETLVVGDWLDMPGIAAGSVDMVLGDASLNNITHAQMPRLWAQFKAVTHPGSVLSLRQMTLMAQGSTVHSIERTVQRFRDGELDTHVFGKLLRFTCFTDELYDAELRVLDGRRVFERIDECHRDGLINETEHALMNKRRSAIEHTIYLTADQQGWFEQLGSCRVELAGAATDHRYLFDLWVTERS